MYQNDIQIFDIPWVFYINFKSGKYTILLIGLVFVTVVRFHINTSNVFFTVTTVLFFVDIIKW